MSCRSYDCRDYGCIDSRCEWYEEDEKIMTEPKTLAEQLDAAEDGTEFGQVLQGLFKYLEQAKDE